MVVANDNKPCGASIRFLVVPRLIPATKAARRLHLSPSEFKDKLSQLQDHGFPRACLVTDHFDLTAIDAWLDRQVGLSPTSAASGADLEQTISERLARLG